jgi:hypothetical protein
MYRIKILPLIRLVHRTTDYFVTIVYHSMPFRLSRQERIFDLFVVFTYVFYGSAMLGATFIRPEWFLSADYFAKIYVASFLIYRYNPFAKTVVFTSMDRKVGFHAGLFILITLFTKSILVDYLGKDSVWVKEAGICKVEDNDKPVDLMTQ